MKKLYLVVSMLAALLLTGCEQTKSTSATSGNTNGASNDHGHAHSDDHNHNHGNDADHDHAHDHSVQGHAHDHSVQGHTHGVGPHNGTIADWGGGKYHVELTVEHDARKATVHILGPDEKTARPIDAESIELSLIEPAIQIMLTATPQENDPEGTASRFTGTNEQLGVAQEYAGTMTGVVDGTPYSGDFKEESDEHEL